MHRRRRGGRVVLGALAGILLPHQAHAEGGELYIGAEGTVAAARLGYPRPEMKQGDPGPWNVEGGGGVWLRYGLSDDWQVGLIWGASRAGSVRHEDVVIDGREGDLFAEYGDMTLRVSGSYYLGTGYDYSGLVTVSAGVAWVSWRDQGFVDPDTTDASGNLRRYPIDEQSSTDVGLSCGVSLMGEWRPWGWFSVLAGPFVEVRQSRMAGTSAWNIHAGIKLSPALVLGVGPSF